MVFHQFRRFFAGHLLARWPFGSTFVRLIGWLCQPWWVVQAVFCLHDSWLSANSSWCFFIVCGFFVLPMHSRKFISPSSRGDSGMMRSPHTVFQLALPMLTCVIYQCVWVVDWLIIPVFHCSLNWLYYSMRSIDWLIDFLEDGRLSIALFRLQILNCNQSNFFSGIASGFRKIMSLRGKNRHRSSPCTCFSSIEIF